MVSLREIELTAGQSIVETLDGASLSFSTPSFTFSAPCTITKIVKDFDLIPGGQSPKTMLAICIIRRSTVPEPARPTFDGQPKGIKCTLKPTPCSTPLALMVWHGGLMPGAGVYNFTLVDASYKA